jgi:hypothetical protein
LFTAYRQEWRGSGGSGLGWPSRSSTRDAFVFGGNVDAAVTRPRRPASNRRNAPFTNSMIKSAAIEQGYGSHAPLKLCSPVVEIPT